MEAGSGWPLATDIVVYNEVLLGRGSLERVPVGIGVWRTEGTPLFANRCLRAWLGLGDNLPTLDAFWSLFGLDMPPEPADGTVRLTRGDNPSAFTYRLDAVRNLEGRVIAAAVYLAPAPSSSRPPSQGGDDAGADAAAGGETLGFMLLRDGRVESWTTLSPRWPDMGAWQGSPIAAVLDHLGEEAALGRIPPFTARRHPLSDGTVLVRVEAEGQEALPAASLGSDRLIAATAHEIRNPLATIRGFLQILPGAAQADRERYAAIAVREVDRIVDVVNEFLQGPDEAADGDPPVDLSAVAAGAAAALQSTSQAKGVQVALQLEDQPVWVTGHPTRLHQVATNLIKNALDAVPERSGKVWVEVRREGGWARLCVEDNGPGIPEEWWEHVFDPAFSRREGGHGLGLAITRWIVALYHGHVGVGRAAAGGARLEVHLPAVARPPDAGRQDGPGAEADGPFGDDNSTRRHEHPSPLP